MTHARILTSRMVLVIGALLVAGLGWAAGEVRGQIPGSELVGTLTKTLSVTPEQAGGGAGALFNLAKGRLKPEEFSKVASAVPDMDALLKAAPKPKGLSGLGSMLPGSAGELSGVLDSFKSLGLSPDMVGKFTPVITQYVESKAGPSVGQLLAAALK